MTVGSPPATANSGSAGRQAAAPRSRRRRRFPGWLWFVLPALVVFTIFAFVPVVEVVVLSFFDWNLISPDAEFVGLQFYRELLSDPAFWSLLWQTIAYILIALLINFILPVAVAGVTLSLGRRLSQIYQMLYFVPTVIATSVAALLWMWMYLPIGGMINGLIGKIGIPAQNWLTNPDLVLPAVATVAVWKFFGFNFLIALAGITAVPRSYVEAGLVDGAGWWARWRHIILPTMAPTLLFLGITTAVQALNNAFVPIQLMTQGGPSGKSSNLLYAVYEQSFRFFKVGSASTQAVVLMVLLGGLAIWQFRMMDKRVDHGD